MKSFVQCINTQKCIYVLAVSKQRTLKAPKKILKTRPKINLPGRNDSARRQLLQAALGHAHPDRTHDLGHVIQEILLLFFFSWFGQDAMVDVRVIPHERGLEVIVISVTMNSLEGGHSQKKVWYKEG